MNDSRPFSKVWMFASMGIFIAVELLLGGLIGDVLISRYMSISLQFLSQGLLHIVSFFVGGFIVGLQVHLWWFRPVHTGSYPLRRSRSSGVRVR